MVFTSSLRRDCETGSLVAEASRATLVSLGEDLFPQDLGKLSGRLKEEVTTKMEGLVANPRKTPIGGESMDRFKRTFLPVWRSLLRMSRLQAIGLVTHGSNIQLVNAWLSAGMKDSLELNPGALGLKVNPSAVYYVDPDNCLGVPQIVLTQADLAPLAPGLYQIRHGRTAWSGQ